SVRRPRVYLAYFVTEDRVSSGNHFFAPTQRIGFLVAVTGRQRSARAGAPPFHLRHFLLFADYAAAAEAEKVEDDALVLRVPPDNLKLEISRASVVTVTPAEEGKS